MLAENGRKMEKKRGKMLFNKMKKKINLVFLLHKPNIFFNFSIHKVKSNRENSHSHTTIIQHSFTK